MSGQLEYSDDSEKLDDSQQSEELSDPHGFSAQRVRGFWGDLHLYWRRVRFRESFPRNGESN